MKGTLTERPVSTTRTRLRLAGVPALLFVALIAGLVMQPSLACASATPFAQQEARLHGPTAADDDLFGAAVDISGNTLVVGAPRRESVGGALDAGAAYVYVRSGTSWTLQATLWAPGPLAGDRFGTSVAIDGDRIVVGAPYRDTAAAEGESGAAYVFTRTGTTWSSAVTLPTELAQLNDMIGYSVDIDGTDIVIGCPGASSNRGAVRPIYWDGAGWNSGGGVLLTDTFDGPQVDDRLGGSVAISGNTLIASEGGEDQSGITDCGAFLVWARGADSWTLIQQQYAPVRVAGEQFGGPIDISASGYTAIIGSPGYGPDHVRPIGRAYIYTDPFAESEFGHYATLENPGPNSPDGDNFGSSVALDEDSLALVGAFWDESHTGAAYYFEYGAGTWTMRQKIDVTAETPGVSLFGDAVALSNGTAVVGASQASAGTAGVLPGGVFVYNSRGTVTGTVTDALTGLPIAGVEVSAYVLDAYGEPQLARGTSLAMTDADGHYTLSVDTGDYPLGWMHAVYAAGFYYEGVVHTDAMPVTVQSGGVTTIDLALRMQPMKRIENDAAGVTFGRLITAHSTAFSGGSYTYAYSKAPYTGTRMEARFYGTTVRWIGPKQPSYGKANVYIDGVLQGAYDCYAASGTLSATIFEKTGLAPGWHTITVEMRADKNAASTGYVVVIDKFQTEGVGAKGIGPRYSEAAGTFIGGWVKVAGNPTYTDSSYAYSYWPGARFIRGFTGTRVAWIGPKVSSYGRAAVYIDGSYKGVVSQYAPTTATAFRAKVWESAVLSAGNHYIEIRPLGTKDAASSGTVVVIDGIDVTP